MNKDELIKSGIPEGPVLKEALKAAQKAGKSGKKENEIKELVYRLSSKPETLLMNKIFKKAARLLIEEKSGENMTTEPLVEAAPYQIWGSNIEKEAIAQMDKACLLPVSVKGALMPDAHTGYGLPIGGVLATTNAVIPFAVGMDIACRMKMSVLNIGLNEFESNRDRFKNAINRETCFGVGVGYKMADRKNHRVMDEEWSFSKFIASLKDKAWKQLGTSGSGNHFVEFGELTVYKKLKGLAPGSYLAFLSHSGSRGSGAEIAQHYSRLAKNICRGLPANFSQLAWLDLKKETGQEYWQAMELMGRYAAANHELIHNAVSSNLGVEVILDIENHHNFAWKERYGGRELVIHRKGATPAAEDAYGIIPGSMATPGFVVKGRGNRLSLNSAAHGAGRLMSRKAAKKNYRWKDAENLLREKGIEIMSAGLDEVPMAYKDIHAVMEAQKDLVEIMARFDPRLVKMAP